MPRKNKQSKEPRVVKFRATLADDVTHRQIGVIKFTRWRLFTAVLTIVLLLFAAFILLVAYTPLKTFVPGFPDAETKRASVQNSIKIDSLENVVARWEFYTENLKRVLNGDDPMVIDSIIRNSRQGKDTLDAATAQARDSLLRETVKDAEQFSINQNRPRSLPIEGMHFFTPLQGVISQPYDKALHPYVEISAPANSVVMSVLDGTVVSAEWSDEYQYSIIIQHDDGIISIYRRSQKLLHSAGEKVDAGSPLALVGSTGSAEGSGKIMFELWHKGEAVNPTDYISF